MIPLATYIYLFLMDDKPKKRRWIETHCPDKVKHRMRFGRCIRCGYTRRRK